MSDLNGSPTSRFKRITQRGRALLLPRIIPIAVLIGVILAVVWAGLASAPADFASPRIVTVEQGATLKSEAQALKDAHVVRFGTLFTFAAIILGGEKGLIAGDYYFAAPQNVFTIAARLTGGNYDLDPVRVTIPEGATIQEIGQILSQKLITFDAARFYALTEGKEGYLFPDTYYFLPTEKPETVINSMESNFYRRIETLRPAIESSGRSLHDLITMASLLEEEARTPTTRRLISGILWKRIELGMRLQVDAVFPYILGKNTFEVTLADLKVDSPYNTYLYAGLPLGPISNPGLVSIEAAARPTASPYLFYLSDLSGGMHYSRTYEEHLRKKRLYLGS